LIMQLVRWWRLSPLQTCLQIAASLMPSVWWSGEYKKKKTTTTIVLFISSSFLPPIEHLSTGCINEYQPTNDEGRGGINLSLAQLFLSWYRERRRITQTSFPFFKIFAENIENAVFTAVKISRIWE
jgi:hypothetical protein